MTAGITTGQEAMGATVSKSHVTVVEVPTINRWLRVANIEEAVGDPMAHPVKKTRSTRSGRGSQEVGLSLTRACQAEGSREMPGLVVARVHTLAAGEPRLDFMVERLVWPVVPCEVDQRPQW